MGVIFPPIPFSTSIELKMFNDWILCNPKPNDRQRQQFAATFKENANGSTIFPKLPSMVKEHDKRWETNNMIQLAQKSMNAEYTQLLDGLSSIHAPDPTEQQPQEINLNNVEGDNNSSDTPLLDSTQPLFVPPVSAPYQQQYQPVDQTSRAATAQLDRACANPFCTCLQKTAGVIIQKNVEIITTRTSWKN